VLTVETVPTVAIGIDFPVLTAYLLAWLERVLYRQPRYFSIGTSTRSVVRSEMKHKHLGFRDIGKYTIPTA
jgi:hypothetical protein